MSSDSGPAGSGVVFRTPYSSFIRQPQLRGAPEHIRHWRHWRQNTLGLFCTVRSSHGGRESKRACARLTGGAGRWAGSWSRHLSICPCSPS